jgi:NAD(P)-dependent dehydrogenase (short-subunit alcohol dehydrogenase family)
MLNKTAVIIGATGEIGSTLSRQLDELGFSLILVGRDEKKLRNLRDELSPKGHSVEVLNLNEGLEDLESKISLIVKKNKAVSSLIYTAGTINVVPFMQSTRKHWIESFETNLFAAVECIKGFVRAVSVEVENKSIVIMSSVASNGGQLGLSSYASSKAALESMSKSAARELARKGVRVNTVQMGLMESGLGSEIEARVGSENFGNLISEYPLGAGLPSDAANAAIFLMSERARWITGSNLVVDGGLLTR